MTLFAITMNCLEIYKFCVGQALKYYTVNWMAKKYPLRCTVQPSHVHWVWIPFPESSVHATADSGQWASGKTFRSSPTEKRTWKCSSLTQGGSTTHNLTFLWALLTPDVSTTHNLTSLWLLESCGKKRIKLSYKELQAMCLGASGHKENSLFIFKA